MDYIDLYTLDIRLKLLGGLPIEVPKVGLLRPFRLYEIASVGYTEFSRRLNALTMDTEKALGKSIELANGVKMNPFDIFSIIPDQEFKSVFLEGISFFFNEEKVFHTKVPIENNILVDIVVLGVDNLKDQDDSKPLRVIHRENFAYICEALKLQNGLKDVFDEDSYNVKDKKARELAEKLRKANETINKLKRNKSKGKSSDIDIFDIISAVSTKSNSVNSMNVWDMTLYQLYDHYRRLHAINQYDVNIQAIMNGAENIDLEDWSARLDKY